MQARLVASRLAHRTVTSFVLLMNAIYIYMYMRPAGPDCIHGIDMCNRYIWSTAFYGNFQNCTICFSFSLRGTLTATDILPVSILAVISTVYAKLIKNQGVSQAVHIYISFIITVVRVVHVQVHAVHKNKKAYTKYN